MTEGKTSWSKISNSYLKETNINIYNISQLCIKLIKNKINDLDSDKWKNKMINLSTLSRYRSQKESIQETKWFRNGNKFSLMMKARANVLKLNWRNQGNEELKKCSLCKCHIETIDHFLLDCDKLQLIRNKYLILQRPQILDADSIINKML